MLLEAKHLYVRYRLGKKYVHAVNDISLSVDEGKSLGLVGESGCGKTSLIKALICLLPKNCEMSGGNIYFEGKDLIRMNRKEIRRIRWKDFSIIPQSAMNALNPVYKIRHQIAEAIKEHESIHKRELNQRLEYLFSLVGLDTKRLDSYPHQLSGGMRQRAVIAMSLALNPKLVIADEPTTALDVVTQRHIIDGINALRRKLNLALIYVSHDIFVIAETCDTVAMMYAGKILELGPRKMILEKPYHPYTLGFKNAVPQLGVMKRLISLSGFPPDLTNLPSGCRFYSRCPFSEERCTKIDPPLEEVQQGHYVACLRVNQIEELRKLARDEKTWIV
jgi:peptide/nickel transport system ATP-binding protein